MAFETNEGMDKLASVLTSRIHSQTESDLIIDFGTIESDYSLKTNTFSKVIPKTDYLVCRSLCYGAAGTPLTAAADGKHGGHAGGDGAHVHLVPDKMRTLLPGDRVLVAWVQNDAVVVDIIKPASEV